MLTVWNNVSFEGQKPTEEKYFDAQLLQQGITNNSPDTIKVRSLNVSPANRMPIRKTFSEDFLVNKKSKKAESNIVSFQHVLSSALENLEISDFGKELGIPILLVDDSSVNLKLLRNILKRFGFTNIATASNGLEAVMLCKSHVYDVIFMDGEMPIMDGLEAIETIRKDEEGLNTHTFIIIQSAADSDKVNNMKKAAGEHSAFIDKPYKKDSTIAAFAKLSKDLGNVISNEREGKGFKL